MANQEYTTTDPSDSPQIPFGFCHCGCGQRTGIAEWDRPQRMWVKGQPKRFIAGHYARSIRTTAEDLWALIDKSGGPDSCWLWTGPKDKGYGRVSWQGKTLSAHRVAWLLVKGPIPDGMSVCHDCPGGDNRACCNSSHHFLGTTADNSADMVAKGRSLHRFGALHPRAKLTRAIVDEIRRKYATGQYSQSQLGAEYGVTQVHIGQIVRHEQW